MRGQHPGVISSSTRGQVWIRGGNPQGLYPHLHGGKCGYEGATPGGYILIYTGASVDTRGQHLGVISSSTRGQVWIRGGNTRGLYPHLHGGKCGYEGGNTRGLYPHLHGGKCGYEGATPGGYILIYTGASVDTRGQHPGVISSSTRGQVWI
ncbi:hypothetical protein GDO81_026476 [Engystomops pustulosus]|uniref:Uncharacterized protein n=1 Tax=Engystomops pustulosus TaxID=76066 RepID=A0AAV6YNL7_ENGPU|nr:hypothetical protein GDO81_026476 [Engystomops pustulosus]